MSTAASPQLVAHKPLTRKSAGIILGLLLLLTFVIPFDVVSGKPTWSWDLLQNIRNMRWQMAAFLIGAWAIGLAALILGSAMRGIALSIAYLVLSAAAVVLIYLAFLRGSSVPMGYSSRVLKFLSPKALNIIAVASPAVFLVVVGVRLRLGGSILGNLVELLVGGAFAALWGILTYEAIRGWSMPAGASGWTWAAAIIGIATSAILALAGLLAFLHSFAFRSNHGGASAAAKTIVILLLILRVAWSIAAPAIQAKSFRVVLNVLAVNVMLFCEALLALEALVSIFSELGGMAIAPEKLPSAVRPDQAVPAAARQPAAAASVQADERLRQLDALRAKGAISAEEYKAQRDRILGQL